MVRRRSQIFLLSPANMSGLRGRRLFSEQGEAVLRRNLSGEGMPLGELFAAISGLYFRGKLAYARAYGVAAKGLAGAYVITSSGGLVSPEIPVTMEGLRALCSANIDCANSFYREPLERDLRLLVGRAPAACRFILLGSIATPKYLQPLLQILGERLFFPAEFAGRGDMSRGGLLLRAVESGTELHYVEAATAARHGSRPPKLEPNKRIV